MKNTTNLKLKLPDPTDYVLVEDLNENFTKLDTEIAKITDEETGVEVKLTKHLDDYTDHVPYVVDSGTANAKVVTLNPAPASYVEGMAIAFKNRVANTGAVTINVNDLGTKAIVKANGSALASGSLKANSVYTLRYNGTSFFLQGEGGEYGTATASQVLSGYTIGTESGVVSGTITSKAAATITPGTSNQTIAANQFLSGVQTIVGDPDLVAANIVSGKNIFGVAGTATASTLGGKRFARGTGQTITGGILEVTGLAFTPSIVITKSGNTDTEESSFTVYVPKAQFSGSPRSGISAWVSGDVYAGNFTSISNGFRMQVDSGVSNIVFSWIVFE